MSVTSFLPWSRPIKVSLSVDLYSRLQRQQRQILTNKILNFSQTKKILRSMNQALPQKSQQAGANTMTNLLSLIAGVSIHQATGEMPQIP